MNDAVYADFGTRLDAIGEECEAILEKVLMLMGVSTVLVETSKILAGNSAVLVGTSIVLPKVSVVVEEASSEVKLDVESCVVVSISVEMLVEKSLLDSVEGAGKASDEALVKLSKEAVLNL